MIAPLVLAQLSHSIYGSLDGFSKSWTIDGVVVALARVDDVDVIVLRGSATAEDWMRDAAALPVWHPGLGFCHGGFLMGMDAVFEVVRAEVGPKVAITGHSLGGARARILAAMFIMAGVRGGLVWTFGSPKPGFANLARIIQKSDWDHGSHRNRNDAVPLTLLASWWEHTENWTTCNAAPAQSNLEALRDHSSALYVQALGGTGSVPVADQK